jgi:hypothetical protein
MELVIIVKNGNIDFGGGNYKNKEELLKDFIKYIKSN